MCGVLGIHLLGETFAAGAEATTFTTTDMSVMMGSLVVRAFWSVLKIYLLTVAVRILGLLYLTQKDKLGWL
jgi:hypothetical protein